MINLINFKWILVFIMLNSLAVSLYAQTDGWKPLFDGKTFKGWKVLGGTSLFTIEDGAIVGKTVLNSGNTFLTTEKEYGDFILEVYKNGKR